MCTCRASPGSCRACRPTRGPRCCCWRTTTSRWRRWPAMPAPGLGLARLRPSDDLPTLLRSIQPSALAWDLAQANLKDWSMLQQIRGLPQLAQLPLIVYGQAQPGESGVTLGLTSFLVKPLSSPALIDALNALRPAGPDGLVLIVDDDPQALRLYEGIVAAELPSYRVETSDSGAAAIERLRHTVPSLVLLDLIMPEVDGFAVSSICARSRSCAACPCW
ncbi:response regulator [Kouleothrix sp.]|uniref:response regulator n=1 Tax=Kouleothrix sp. TaxID=2779161 RepID=UPI00391D395C